MATEIFADRTLPAAGTDALEETWRFVMDHVMGAFNRDGPVLGVGGGLKCTGNSTGLNVQIGNGVGVIDGVCGDFQSAMSLDVANNGSANTRIDLVALALVKPDNPNNLTSLAQQLSVRIITGTPSATPTAPLATISSTLIEVPIAEVTLGPSDLIVDPGDVADLRPNALTPYAAILKNSADGTVSSSDVTTDWAVYRPEGGMCHQKVIYRFTGVLGSSLDLRVPYPPGQTAETTDQIAAASCTVELASGAQLPATSMTPKNNGWEMRAWDESTNRSHTADNISGQRLYVNSGGTDVAVASGDRIIVDVRFGVTL